MGKGILVFVDNMMSSATKTDKLEMDIIEVPLKTENGDECKLVSLN